MMLTSYYIQFPGTHGQTAGSAEEIRLKAGCAVENPAKVGRTPGRTPWSPAGPPASLSEVRRKRQNLWVFITVCGPPGQADSQDWLPYKRTPN
jgi:hypothetical protein